MALVAGQTFVQVVARDLLAFNQSSWQPSAFLPEAVSSKSIEAFPGQARLFHSTVWANNISMMFTLTRNLMPPFQPLSSETTGQSYWHRESRRKKRQGFNSYAEPTESWGESSLMVLILTKTDYKAYTVKFT